MKAICITIISLIFFSFTPNENAVNDVINYDKISGGSFSLINDTKEKISIYTGTGFVSLNKSSKTSIGCNVGKEVRWANKGKKGNVIFKITNSMCGKTLKLSTLID